MGTGRLYFMISFLSSFHNPLSTLKTTVSWKIIIVCFWTKEERAFILLSLLILLSKGNAYYISILVGTDTYLQEGFAFGNFHHLILPVASSRARSEHPFFPDLLKLIWGKFSSLPRVKVKGLFLSCYQSIAI